MILFSAMCAAVAVGLLVPTDPRRSSAHRLSEPVEHAAGAVHRVVAVIVLGSAAVGIAVLAASAGTATAVVATAVLASGATTGMLVRRRVADRQRARRRQEVARACAAVAAQVRVGRVPTAALTTAAADHPVLAVPARTVAVGGDVVRSLHAEARRPGHGGLAELGCAWHFCVDTGAPMTASLDQVAASLRDDQATQRTVDAELAGPRASGLVMAVLPVLGIGLGYLIGGDPIGFLIRGPTGWACLLAGTGLALAGVVWMDKLARISEPGRDPARDPTHG